MIAALEGNAELVCALLGANGIDVNVEGQVVQLRYTKLARLRLSITNSCAACHGSSRKPSLRLPTRTCFRPLARSLLARQHASLRFQTAYRACTS